MLTKPSVSACIVLYHPDLDVMLTINCLHASPLPIQLVVVDNSPEDPNSQKIHDSLNESDIYVNMKKNCGFGAANNAALKCISSTYHLIINPDITFTPSLIPQMVEYMESHKDITILTPRVLNVDGTEQYLPRRQPTLRYLLGGKLENKPGPFASWRQEYTLQNQSITQPMKVGFATGCFLFIRTHAFFSLQGFDEHFFLYHEDSDLSRRVIEGGGCIVYHPDMCVTHAWHRASSHNFKNLMRHVHSTIKFFNKWGWRW